MKSSPSSAASTCVPFQSSAPPSHFPLGRCHHGQIVHRKGLTSAHNFLCLSFFNTSSLSPVEICIPTRKAACVCVCVRATPKGPGIPESCARTASVAELSLCLSLHTPFLFSSCSRPDREGGEDSQGVGQKIEAAFSQLFLSHPLLLPPSFPRLFFPNFYALSFGLFSVTDTLSLLSKAWKQSSLCHTHILTPSSFFRRHSLCLSPEVKSLPRSVTQPQCLSPAIMIHCAVSSKVQHCVAPCVSACVCLSDPTHFLGWCSCEKDEGETGIRVHLTLRFHVSLKFFHIIHTTH